MRSKKAFYNIIALGGYEIIAMVCGLILPRLILQAFGSRYNGMITSITQFLDYISILTAGVSGATRVALYKSISVNDIKNTSAIIKATEIFLRKIAFVFIAYMLILSVVYPFAIGGDFRWIEVSSLVIIIGLGTFAEYYFGITYRTFLVASQSQYIYNIIQIFVKIINTIIAVVLIKLNCSIFIVKLGSACCFVLSPIILSKYVKKKYKLISDVEPNDSALKQRWDVVGHTVANCVHLYTDVFLLTIFSGVEIVSVYTVYDFVVNSVKKLMNIFNVGLEAAFGDMWAKGEIETIKKNLNTYEFIIYSFVIVVFSCVGLLILPFVSLYTKGINDVNYIRPAFAIVLTITNAAYCLRTPYLTLTQAAGKYKETRNGAFFEALLNLCISLILVYRFNLIGVVIGTLFANLFRTFQYVIYVSKRLIHRNILKVIYRLIWLICTSLFIVSLGYYEIYILFVVSWTWYFWVVYGLIIAFQAVLITILSASIFYRKDLLNMFGFIKKMTSKRSKSNDIK